MVTRKSPIIPAVLPTQNRLDHFMHTDLLDTRFATHEKDSGAHVATVNLLPQFFAA